ncbi:N-acetyltransferase, partial [Halobacillus sp. BBL2006]|uniref:GNAT family N-acetyltransferase n=1 Tax=Halobacillus sp. BBL2006 TaxID=1543706 RepID=UPI000542C29A
SFFLYRKIKEYNNARSNPHKQSRDPGAVKPIHLIVSDEQGDWIGGITGDVYWGWLEINDFWLSDECRRQGLGTQLLNQAEDTAIELGAGKVLLSTFGFQARPFYEKHGYEVVGEIKDYPPRSSFYTMVKKLR